jgi:hypothetical protein
VSFLATPGGVAGKSTMLHRADPPVVWGMILNFDNLVCALPCTLHSGKLGGHVVALEEPWDG